MLLARTILKAQTMSRYLTKNMILHCFPKIRKLVWKIKTAGNFSFEKNYILSESMNDSFKESRIFCSVGTKKAETHYNFLVVVLVALKK